MRFCKDHWDLCRKTVDDFGLGGLVAKDGETALENIVDELKGNTPKFDPLMSMHWHWTNEALRCGGLYLMGQNKTGVNDGQYCPMCEFEKNVPDFDAKESVEAVAKQMAEWARTEGLIPKVS